MDDRRFDGWVRRLREGRTRRTLARGLVGGVVAIAGAARLGDPVAAGCGPCGRKKRGRCVERRDDARCGGDGRCFNGRCVPRPTCEPPGTPCGVDFEGCCEGFTGCLFGTGCIETGPGRPCYGDGECAFNLRCVGYRCRVAD